ncbi:MAG TPA: squalene synthase HpnC [Bacteroidota bacterium]|nr:squalene synthase HpnC [Bacteroidota bacterium]
MSVTADIARGMSTDEAFQYCARLTEAHYENFPVASLLIPDQKRPYIQAIYAFSRMADDFADEGDLTKEERLRRLDEWETALRDCYNGIATHPVFIALRETVKQQRIPPEPLLDLIAAFKRDVVQSRYETFADLLDYCRCSANPVGRIVLMIFDHRNDDLFRKSDAICTALQLTNFWQDVAVDARKDRLYIPLEDMRSHSYSESSWKKGEYSEEFRNLMKFQVERTRTFFFDGAELPRLVEKELQIELRLVWFGGMSVLRMLERRKYDIFSRRPSLSLFDKAVILGKGLLTADPAKLRKKSKPWDLT